MNDGRFVCTTDTRNGGIIREIKSPRAKSAPAINRLGFHLDLLTRPLCYCLRDSPISLLIALFRRLQVGKNLRSILLTLNRSENRADNLRTDQTCSNVKRCWFQSCYPSLPPPFVIRSVSKQVHSIRESGCVRDRSGSVTNRFPVRETYKILSLSLNDASTA
jgi:hypothetical protein